MKVTRPFLGATLLGLLALASCKNMDYKKTKEGFLYRVIGEGKGDKVVPGSVIRIHTTSRLGDSVIGTSYGREPQTIPVPKDGAQLEAFKILFDAHKGDSVLLLQPVDSILARVKMQNPMAPPDPLLTANKGKNLQTYFKIVDVFKDEASAKPVLQKEALESYEKREKEGLANFTKDTAVARQKAIDEAAITAYLSSKGIKTSRSPWGTYVQTLTPGNGQKPKFGQFISVRYTGKFMNGEVFDTNNKPGAEPYPVQVGAGGSILGFEDGLKQLSKGEKAVLYIPSVIGYGAQGQQPKIGPNQNLMFDIDVVDVSDERPMQQPMPMPDTTKSARAK